MSMVSVIIECHHYVNAGRSSVVDPKPYYGSGYDFSMSFGSGPDFQKVQDPVSEPAFLLMKNDVIGPKMTFQYIIFKEYLNLL
jgi:hypothetical protein